MGGTELEHRGAGLAPATWWHWGGDTGDTVPSSAGHGVGAEGACTGQKGPHGAAVLCAALTCPRCSPSSAVESKSTVSILDDIGSMFDDLADQLDAMLE